MQSPPLIETRELTRKFKDNIAVNKLDLQIRPGETFGLVGPDGAGKTTAIRLLTGLIKITSGSAQIAGYDLDKDPEPIKPMYGYMAQQFSLYGDLSVAENLSLFADLFNVPQKEKAERMEKLLQFANLTEFTSRRAAHLSGGMKKKLALACTLIHRPRILFLDEPTTGVDPVSRREFWDLLTELQIEGTTIIVSTPYMDEAERCQRVGLMYQGKMIVCDTPKAIINSIKGELIEFHTTDNRRAVQFLENLPGVLELQTYGKLLRLFVDNVDARIPEITRTLKNQMIQIEGIRRTRPHMEEAFISMINALEEQK